MSFNFFPNKDDKKTENGLTENYVIIRSKNSGVFAGNLLSMDQGTCILKDARRLWYWSGAASLSELAMKGVSKPDECKFPCEVKEILINEVLECIPCTKEAYKSIKRVKEWSAS